MSAFTFSCVIAILSLLPLHLTSVPANWICSTLQGKKLGEIPNPFLSCPFQLKREGKSLRGGGGHVTQFVRGFWGSFLDTTDLDSSLLSTLDISVMPGAEAAIL